MSKTRQSPARTLAAHAVLIVWTLIALFPVFVTVVNSFKSKKAIFTQPLALPGPGSFDLIGYQTVAKQGDFVAYFQNSLAVTCLSLQMMVATGLVNTLTALVLVYTAQGLPLAVFILSEFMRTVSDDLKNAGRIDGLSEYRIFFRLVLPLVRPAMATVAVFTMIPIWNDLWFPLILAPSEATKTITLGSQVFLGQFVSNWNAVLAALSLAILPVLVLYLIFSRQLIRGITAGAVK